MENCISNLRPTEISDDLLVHHNVSLTMTDGKVATALSTVTNSMQSCPICGASPKILNNIEEVKTRQEALKHGLSTLHAWIRCKECCLHISYKTDIQKWQAHTPEEKSQ